MAWVDLRRGRLCSARVVCLAVTLFNSFSEAVLGLSGRGGAVEIGSESFRLARTKARRSGETAEEIVLISNVNKHLDNLDGI
ncbi:hypothetical protein OG223_53235 [Streptomyces sp. NBC_01478]|uniref:hypothetical protein n=1 Tax=Streptomyces sp. NBC_01478 TaxID=2903882 RepID=UPI002E304772|nr:hypothetical protein [Streptomyces sp. NBC_01478]